MTHKIEETKRPWGEEITLRQFIDETLNRTTKRWLFNVFLFLGVIALIS